MCGICGFVHNRQVDNNTISEMTDVLSHRGPDDKGVYIENIDGIQVGLGHRRLSVLDLSPNGHQPMFSPDNDVVIVYNGEIYNFHELREELKNVGATFKSNCDTEVILHSYLAWGISCVNRFNGMFAIAILDCKEKTLYLVRDRMGVKPLFYYYDGFNLAFGSELKSILKYPGFKKEIDEIALCEYLERDAISGEKCIYKKVSKVLPGTIIKWKNGNIEKKEYWSITKKSQESFLGDYDDALKTLEKLVVDSVKKRLISDVPIGCFLSGGVDSSLITAVMQSINKSPISTFTIGFEEDVYDESKYAEQIANYLGTKHHCTKLSVKEGKEYLNMMPYYYDEPIADNSAIATMMLSKVTKNNVTVALTGDAGDELFCGYDNYSAIKKYSKWIPISKLANSNSLLRNVLFRMSEKTKRLVEMKSWNDVIVSMGMKERRLVSCLSKNGIYDDRAYKLLDSSEIPEKKYMLMDLGIYLPDDILVKVDRAGMAVSLETRNPLLDYRLVEFSMSLPIEFSYNQGIQKRILKDLACKYIPKQLFERPKKGFGVPTREWLSQDFSDLTKDYFEKDFICKQGLFNYEKVDKIVRLFSEKKDMRFYKDVWTLLVFQMWWDKWMN